MSKELTEQWREGTLPAGYYYVVDVEGVKDLDDFNGENFSLLEVKEVLGPVPDYMDCKGLMYDSIALDKVRKKVAELSSENGRLQYDNDVLSTVNDELLKKVERLEDRLKEAESLIYYVANNSKYGPIYEPTYVYCQKYGVEK